MRSRVRRAVGARPKSYCNAPRRGEPETPSRAPPRPALTGGYDKNRSQDPKDRCVRRTYEAQFSTPIFRSRRDLLTAEARYSPRLYARQIKVDNERVARKDRRWVFEADYERPLARDVRLGLNYRYETRGSNDPDKRFGSHVFGATFGFDWWR